MNAAQGPQRGAQGRGKEHRGGAVTREPGAQTQALTKGLLTAQTEASDGFRKPEVTGLTVWIFRVTELGLTGQGLGGSHSSSPEFLGS